MTSLGMTGQHLCVPLSEIDFYFIYTLTLFTNLKLKRIMDKKELKFYEAPACEVVELKSNVALLAGSGEGSGGVSDPDLGDEE